jgi:hypothetical protein
MFLKNSNIFIYGNVTIWQASVYKKLNYVVSKIKQQNNIVMHIPDTSRINQLKQIINGRK